MKFPKSGSEEGWTISQLWLVKQSISWIVIMCVLFLVVAPSLGKIHFLFRTLFVLLPLTVLCHCVVSINTPGTRVGPGRQNRTLAGKKNYGTIPSNSHYTQVLFCINHLVGLRYCCILKISFLGTLEVGEKQCMGKKKKYVLTMATASYACIHHAR